MEKNDVEKYKLTVKTSDKASENYVIDGQFNRVAKGIGEESIFELPKGLYSVKVKVGSEFSEKPVTLIEDLIVNFDQISFNTPIPLQNTFAIATSQSTVAESYSRKEKSDVTIGSGSKLFLFGSINRSEPSQNIPEIHTDPAIGLTLRNYENEILVDFGKPGIGAYNWQGDPWAACDIDLDPGVYTLCLETGEGNILKQNIVTSEGWQTQIFIQPKNYGFEKKDVRADLVNSSVLMSKIGYGFNSESFSNYMYESDFRLTEQIRQALINKRNVISKDVLQNLLVGKFENPMLGIYAAHILLLNTDFIISEIKVVVKNLRLMLGYSHPDVEAIAIKMGMESNYIFNTFPMLANSWNFIIEGSAKKNTLIPTKSQAYKFSGQFWNCDLWLVWGKENKEEKRNLVTNLKSWAQSEFSANEPEHIFSKLPSLLKNIASNKKIKEQILDHLPQYKKVLDDVLTNLSEDAILLASKNYGIPGNKVEQVLKGINLNDIANAVKGFNIETSVDITNDPQKNKWGGKANANFRKMNATVIASSIANLYIVTVTVQSTKKSFPLSGEVKFHLHNTFLNPQPVIPVKDGIAVLKLTAVWGSFTVGAEADKGETRLELDLSELPGIPKEFKDR